MASMNTCLSSGSLEPKHDKGRTKQKSTKWEHENLGVIYTKLNIYKK